MIGMGVGGTCVADETVAPVTTSAGDGIVGEEVDWATGDIIPPVVTSNGEVAGVVITSSMLTDWAWHC